MLCRDTVVAAAAAAQVLVGMQRWREARELMQASLDVCGKRWADKYEGWGGAACLHVVAVAVTPVVLAGGSATRCGWCCLRLRWGSGTTLQQRSSCGMRRSGGPTPP